MTPGEAPKSAETALDRRCPHGWLKYGNAPYDIRNVKRCGARNRRGGACGSPAMANGRCRLHGGLSTGPKTEEGVERIRRASDEAWAVFSGGNRRAQRFREMFKKCREVVFAAKRVLR